MKVLIVGSGGREHAMAECVRRSRHNAEIFCGSGNAGTARFATNVDIQPDQIDELAQFAVAEKIDLTIVGPEAPLCAGIVDRFANRGLRIFGPSAKAARIEGDKAFTKQLLHSAAIPMAVGRWFDRFHHAKDYIATRDTPQVVKAAGLAAGKGVVVCDDPADALLAAERMMVDGQFGDAGRCIVVEEKLNGPELSVQAIVDGQNILVLESSQDHKRIGDGDTGPNTGGMGAYSPAPIATDDVMQRVERQVLLPFVDILRRQDIHYRGVLYCGLMLTAAGPKVLEFNCRFGDPEAQVVLTRLKTDFVDLVNACIDGTLDQIEVEWDPRPAVCVVLASRGYPGSYQKGKTIRGLDAAEALPDVAVYHAGTLRVDDSIVTDGGRVLGVTGMGDDIRGARDRAYEAIERIQFEGVTFRRDIAQRAMKCI